MIDADSSDYHPLSIYLSEVDVTPTTGQTSLPRAWQTSKAIYKTLFTGYATYVDHGCVIYLHEADDKPFLETMCKIIAEKYEQLEEPPEGYEYCVNQPCIARYHLNSKFYRAVIHEKPKENGEWSIRFIDYGNIESVVAKDIKPYAPFPNLPSLANKYTPIGIQANNKNGEYTIDELDRIHVYIVGNFVSVRLPLTELTNSIKKCHIRLGNQDVASVFIEKKWAAQEQFSTPVAKQSMNVSNSGTIKQSKTRNPLPYYVEFDEADTDYKVGCIPSILLMYISRVQFNCR